MTLELVTEAFILIGRGWVGLSQVAVTYSQYIQSDIRASLSFNGNCPSYQKFERLVGHLGEILNISVHKTLPDERDYTTS